MAEYKENVLQKIVFAVIMLVIGGLLFCLGLINKSWSFAIIGAILFVAGLLILFCKQVDPKNLPSEDIAEKKILGEHYDTAKIAADAAIKAEQMIRHPYRTLWNKFIKK